jgi:hypothetical protein
MLGLSGVRMSKVDTAWLRMDSPSNLMMINGVWTVSPGITLAALRERVQERLLQYPRFRQRVVEDRPVPPGWTTSALTSTPMCRPPSCRAAVAKATGRAAPVRGRPGH